MSGETVVFYVLSVGWHMPHIYQIHNCLSMLLLPLLRACELKTENHTWKLNAFYCADVCMFTFVWERVCAFELRTSEHSLYSFIPFLNLDYFDVPVYLTRKPIWYWIFCAQRLTIIATFSITMTLFQWLAFVMKKENKDPNRNGREKVEKSKTWMKANLMRRWKANRKIIMTRWWSVCRFWSSFDEKRYHLQRTLSFK